MERTIILFLVFAALMPSAIPSLLATETHHLPILWLNGAEATSFPAAVAEQEVVEIFRDMDIEVSWVSQTRSQEENTPPPIRVIVISTPPDRWSLPADALGVRIVDGLQARAVYVLLSSLQRALGIAPNMHRRPTPMERRQIAEAVGRVAAHEIVHLLTQSGEHDAGGLMRASWSLSSLTTRKLRVQPATIRQVKTSATLNGPAATKLVDISGTKSLPAIKRERGR